MSDIDDAADKFAEQARLYPVNPDGLRIFGHAAFKAGAQHQAAQSERVAEALEGLLETLPVAETVTDINTRDKARAELKAYRGE